MTDRELMQLVAGRSPAARKAALDALRAIAVDSPAVRHRVGRVSEMALSDTDAEWDDVERSALCAAVIASHGFVPRDDDAINALSALLDRSGLTMATLARTVLGRDERTVRRWISGEVAIPESTAQWIARVLEISSDGDAVTVRVAL